MNATTIRMQFSKWYSECKNAEEAKKLYSTLMEEAEEAQEDRMFEFIQEQNENEQPVAIQKPAGRLTTNKDVDEMSMYELAYNSCFAEDGKAKYRDFLTVRDAREFTRALYRAYANEELPSDDETLDGRLLDDLQYEPEVHIQGLLALFYRNLWAMADMRETLMQHENRAEARRPSYFGDGYADGHLVYDTYECPNCGKQYEVDYDDYDYCPNCGQKLDMTMEEEDGK